MQKFFPDLFHDSGSAFRKRNESVLLKLKQILSLVLGDGEGADPGLPGPPHLRIHGSPVLRGLGDILPGTTSESCVAEQVISRMHKIEH